MTRFDVHIIEFYARIFINQAQYRITHTLMGCGFFLSVIGLYLLVATRVINNDRARSNYDRDEHNIPN